MAQQSPAGGPFDLARHVLVLINQLAESIRQNQRFPSNESIEQVLVAWNSAKPAIIKAAQSLPSSDGRIDAWLTDVATVARQFDQDVRQPGGLTDYLWRTDFGGFSCLAEKGNALFAGLESRQQGADPFAFLDKPRLAEGAKSSPKSPVKVAEAKPKQRGRRKADYETVQREAQISDDWQRARKTGVYKADFTKGKNLTVRALDRLLTRVAKRKTRSDN